MFRLRAQFHKEISSRLEAVYYNAIASSSHYRDLNTHSFKFIGGVMYM